MTNTTTTTARELYLQIGRGGPEHAKDVHDQLLDNPFGGRRSFEGDEPVEDDQLHVVVAFLDDQLDVTLSGGADRWRKFDAKWINENKYERRPKLSGRWGSAYIGRVGNASLGRER